MDLKTVDGLMKYVRRGFRISADPFRLADHDCGEEVIDSPKTGYCPHKLRSTVDEEVLRSNTEGIMVWCLGGWQCKEGDKEETISRHVT